MRTTLMLILALSLAGCTQTDNERANQKLKEAGGKLDHELKDATRKLDRDAHRASEELKHDVNKAKEKIDEKTR